MFGSKPSLTKGPLNVDTFGTPLRSETAKFVGELQLRPENLRLWVPWNALALLDTAG